MSINKKFFNQLATVGDIAPHFPMPPNSYDCAGINDHLNSKLLANPNINIFRLVTGSLRGVLSNITGIFWFLCSANQGPGHSPIDSLSKQEFRDGLRNTQTEIQKAICYIVWGLSNGLGFPSTHPGSFIAREILNALLNMFRFIDQFFNGETNVEGPFGSKYGPMTPELLCSLLAWQIIELEGFVKDPLGSPILDPNNLEICPTSVVDQVLLGLGELVEPETLDLIGEIMMALATALAAAAVLLATLPAGIAAIAYAAAVLAARQAATAALAALVAAGLITQAQADGLVDDMVDGVEACEIEDPVDPKPIDIGVEQGGCCFEGQSIEVPGGQNGCEDINGTWIDDLTQMGCMDLPQNER